MPSDLAPALNVTLLGAPSGMRLGRMRSALRDAGVRDTRCVSYAAFLKDPDALSSVLAPGGWLRCEAPEHDAPCQRALTLRGWRKAERPFATETEIGAMLAETGRILPPRWLVDGLHETLLDISSLCRAAGVIMTPSPQDAALCFDKAACQDACAQAGLPTPTPIGVVENYDDLIAKMMRFDLRQAFVKLRFGSAGAGITALRIGPSGQMIAYTTAETEGDRFYSSLRVRRLDNFRHIRSLIDRLAQFELYAEEWVPKATIGAGCVDLRLIVIRDGPILPMLRSSKAPMTNLHLGGNRHNADLLRERMSEGAWAALENSARRAHDLFPGALMIGVDAAVRTDLTRHVLLEINVFGDFVHGAAKNGLSPQGHQVKQMMRRMAA